MRIATVVISNVETDPRKTSTSKDAMTVRYLHIREVNDKGVIEPRGGVTVAYTIDYANGAVYAAWVKCRPDELFCYQAGREYAAERLANRDGDFEVLDLSHPVSNSIIDWIASEVWPSGPESRGMGFGIDVWQNDKGRWCSDFIPSQLNVIFTPEEADERDPTIDAAGRCQCGHDVHNTSGVGDSCHPSNCAYNK
jgi:hypothetical protein